ncbi:MAG: ABC transporter permease [Spirochaetaceae bacterium]|jgi:ribose/xylose/arabinose/galactoside ABC-type transport system permease subunit|nr:ABC transporter permease [Spirochaetaceae bacterium]
MGKNLIAIEDPLTKRLIWALLGLCGIFILNLIISPEFFEVSLQDGSRLHGNLISILNNGARVCILAVGMTLVYATGGIDLSVGSVMAVSGAMAALIIRPGYLEGLPVMDPQPPMIYIIFLPLVISMLLGLVNGIMVAVVRVQPIIATLIMMYTARGLAALMVKGQTPTYYGVAFTKIGTGYFAGLPIPVWIAFFIFILTLLVTKRSAIGIFIEAIGENKTASRYVGIRTVSMVIGTYVFSSFCAGVAGLVHVSGESNANPYSTGFMIELDAIAAVIIGGSINGGRFTLTGSLIGALIIQSLTTTIYFQRWPYEYSLVFKAIMIILVALIQSEALRKKVMSLVKRRKTVSGGKHA